MQKTDLRILNLEQREALAWIARQLRWEQTLTTLRGATHGATRQAA